MKAQFLIYFLNNQTNIIKKKKKIYINKKSKTNINYIEFYNKLLFLNIILCLICSFWITLRYNLRQKVYG